jgi:predicted transcriptional regulator
MQITIELPDDLERQLISQAEQLHTSIENLILQSLTQSFGHIDGDDEPKEVVLESLRKSWQEAQDGKVRPISELWDGIDA